VDWIVDILENALKIWDYFLKKIWDLARESPEQFNSGTWNAIKSIYEGVSIVGLALMTLFFLLGVVKTCGSIEEAKKPERAFKLFIRFILSKHIVTYGLDILMGIFGVAQWITEKIIAVSGLSEKSFLLDENIKEAVKKTNFFNGFGLAVIGLLTCAAVFVLSIFMIVTVYGRFLKIFIYTAISPIPLSTFAGEPTSSIGRSFLKSWAAICLEGVVVVLACIVSSKIIVDSPNLGDGAHALVLSFAAKTIITLWLLNTTIKAASSTVRDMIGH